MKTVLHKKVSPMDGATIIHEVDFEAAVMLMDDDICERVHNELAPCTDQEFFDRYLKLDPYFCV